MLYCVLYDISELCKMGLIELHKGIGVKWNGSYTQADCLFVKKHEKKWINPVSAGMRATKEVVYINCRRTMNDRTVLLGETKFLGQRSYSS